MDNANSQEYLEKIKVQVIENLKRTTFAPSVQMTDVPRDPDDADDHLLDDLDDDEHKDQRYTKRRWDKYVEKDGELSESEDEDENDRNGVRRQPGTRKRRNMMDYQNSNAVMDDEDLASRGGSSPQEGSRERESPERDDADAPREVDENGSAASSNGNLEGSPVSTDGGSVDASPRVNGIADEDVDMADDSIMLPTPNHVAPSAEGPQEATPPDSPPRILAAAPPLIAPQASDPLGTDPMDEGDTLEDPDLVPNGNHAEPEGEAMAVEPSAMNGDQAGHDINE